MRFTIVFLFYVLFRLSAFASDLPIEPFLTCKSLSENNQFECDVKFEIKDGWKVYFHDEGNEASLNFTLDNKQSRNIHNIVVHWFDSERQYEILNDITYYVSNSSIPFSVFHSGNNYKLVLNLKYSACNISEGYCAIFRDQISHQDVVEPYNSASIYIFLTAILGGLVLNFMPCVLPVLLIKLLHIFRKSENNLRKTRNEVLAIYCGIFFSFLVLAVVTIVMKSLGHFVGWGVHFQQPFFVGFLALITGLSALNMFGLFELTIPLWLQKIFQRFDNHSSNLFSDFLHGVFTVLVATPCTAPFLATAVAFCLSQDPLSIIAVYAAISFGLGMPYMIIILYPKLIKCLPKPGNWMEKFKFISGFPFAFTSAWLLYVLFYQLHDYYVLIGICGLMIYPIIKDMKRFLAAFVSFMILVSVGVYYKNFSKNGIVHLNEFNAETIHNDVKLGKTVLVNITSHWCITCKLNETMVLKDSSVVEKLNKLGVIIVTGDYTNNSDAITQYIKHKNRSGIPLNVVYGPKAQNGIILPIIFNKDELFDAIKKAQKDVI